MKKMMCLILASGVVGSAHAYLASEIQIFNKTNEKMTVTLTEDPAQLATSAGINTLVPHLTHIRSGETEIKPGTNHRFRVTAPSGLKGVFKFSASKKHFIVRMDPPKKTYHITGTDWHDVIQSDENAPVKSYK
jgi:hypothetical protein